MKSALIISLFLTTSLLGQTIENRVKALPNAKDFVVTYDRFQDETIIETRGVVVMDKASHIQLFKPQVAARVVIAGRSVRDDMAFGITFITRSGGSWKFLRDRKLALIVDGERVYFGEGKHDGQVTQGGVAENISFVLTRYQFSQIANAKHVDIQLGQFEGTFEDKALSRYQQLLALVTL